MKKKRLIYYMLMAFLLIGLAFASPFFIKASATEPQYDYYSVNTQSSSFDYWFYFTLNKSTVDTLNNNYNGKMIYLNDNDFISISYYDTINNNDVFIVNNNNSYTLINNSIIFVNFEKGINHFVFYSLSYNFTNSHQNIDFDVNNWDLTQLFTISFSSVNNYVNVFVNSLILQTARIVNSSQAINKTTVIGGINNRLTNSYLFNLINTRNNSGYNYGYNTGYNVGYDEGQLGETAVSPYLNIMTGVWSGLNSILMVEIVPHIRLWYFIALPLFFLVVWAVLRIWKHG